MKEIQVAIIDDQVELLEQMKFAIERAGSGMACVLTAASEEEFFEKWLSLKPRLDVILLDLNLSGNMSMAPLAKIKRLTAPAKIVIVTGYDDPDLLAQAVELGADGYFVKRAKAEPSLREVVQLTYEGGAFLEPRISAHLLRAFQQRKQPARQVNVMAISKACDAFFVKREIEVLDGLLEEQSYQEIADANHISINTVRHYVKSLYQKLGVSSRKALIEKVSSI